MDEDRKIKIGLASLRPIYEMAIQNRYPLHAIYETLLQLETEDPEVLSYLAQSNNFNRSNARS